MYKRVEIFAYHVGLIYRQGLYLKVITPGNHWLKATDLLVVYDTTKNFTIHNQLDILLQDEVFKSLVGVEQVRENELAIHYIDGLFCEVLAPGKYAYWKGIAKHEYRIVETTERMVPKTASLNKWPLIEKGKYTESFFLQVFEKGLLIVDGQLEKHLNSGLYDFWKNEEKIQILTANIRPQVIEVSGQELLTKDKAALRINFFGTFQIIDIEQALIHTQDYKSALYLQLQMALREYIGTMTIDELLAKKEAVADYVLKLTIDKAKEWGLELITVGIRDVILPGDIKEIMNQVLVAEKRAQANIITRREETASTRSLLNTAKLMEGNEMLWKLKEMEYVEKIAEKINSISVSGGSQVVDQLRQIFVAKK